MDSWIPKNITEPKTENAESSAPPPLMSDAFTSELRKLVRSEVGELIRSEVGELIRSEVDAVVSRKLLEIRQLLLKEASHESRSLQLHFEHQSQLSKIILTGRKLQDQRISLKVVLRDDSGNIVQVGAESSVKIEIVALIDDHTTGDRDDLTGDNFEKHYLSGKKIKVPLLMGTCEVSLSNGVADFDDIMFTDNSSWCRSKRFRFGARVVGSVHGVTIKEAVSEPFTVADNRGESFQKMQIPGPTDEVWRLLWIAKGGKINKRLAYANINSVNDLRQVYLANAAELKRILHVSDKKFEAIVDHAMSGYSNIKQAEYLTGAHGGKHETPPEYENLNEQSEICCSNYSLPTGDISETYLRNILLDAPDFIPGVDSKDERMFMPKPGLKKRITWKVLSIFLRFATRIVVIRQRYDKRLVSYKGVRSKDDRYSMQRPGLKKRIRWKVLSAFLRFAAMMIITMRKRYIMMFHCLLFGDNYEFEREKVIQLWMAAGFIEEEPLEEHGDRTFNILLDRGYIIPSKVNIPRQTRLFKVNFELEADFVARAKSIKGFTMTIGDDEVMTNQISESWHISVHTSNINLSTFGSLKKFDMLRTLLFLNGSLLTRIPSDFFSSFKLLTALDLSGSCIRELPCSIQDVTELRYVDLSWTQINRLPASIVNLQKLQTLRLKGCTNLFELPERMKELISLRHLDFDVLGQLIVMPRGLGHLTELRTLTAFIVDGEIINGKECCNIKELMHMNNLSGELCISGLEQLSSEDAQEAALIDKNCLKNLELRWSDVIKSVQEKELVRVLEGLQPNSCLEELKIVCFPGESFPNWIGDQQYQKLVSITLYKCENCLNFPYLGRLPNLKNLEIVEMNSVNQVDDQFCDDGKNHAAFPLLEKLSIDGMCRVEAITNANFACLVKLSLNRCPSLTTLSSYSKCQSLKCVEITDCPLLRYLPEEILSSPLESLVIDACPLLSETYSKGGEHSHKIEHVTNVWIELEETQSSDERSSEDDSSTKDAHSDDMLDEDD